jgi:hypothetical protein
MFTKLEPKSWYSWNFKFLWVLLLCHFFLITSAVAEQRVVSAVWKHTVSSNTFYSDLHLKASTDTDILKAILLCTVNGIPVQIDVIEPPLGTRYVQWDFDIVPPVGDGDEVLCEIIFYLKEWNKITIEEAYFTPRLGIDDYSTTIPSLGVRVTGYQSGGDAFLLNGFSTELVFSHLEFIIIENVDPLIMELWTNGYIPGDSVIPENGTIPPHGEFYVGSFNVPIGQFLLFRATTSFSDTGFSALSATSSVIHEAHSVDLKEFNATNGNDGIHLTWITGNEINNLGFQLWRGMENSNGNYQLTLLTEKSSEVINPDPNEDCSIKIQGQLQIKAPNQPFKPTISAVGDSMASTCYSFEDTNISGKGTYYYVLADIEANGKRSFHCNQIEAVTVGQGAAMDLDRAKNYCREVTKNQN